MKPPNRQVLLLMEFSRMNRAIWCISMESELWFLLPKVGYANYCYFGRLYEKLTSNELWIYLTTNLCK